MKEKIFNFFTGKYANEKAEVWNVIYEEIKYLRPTSLLNIGAGLPDGSQSLYWLSFINMIFPTLENFTNLEIDKEILQKVDKSNKYLAHFVLGDVRNIDVLVQDNPFDVIFWSHGPEHIYRSEWKSTFSKIESVARSLVILQMPWGSGYDKDAHSGHLSLSIRKGELENFGYTAYYVGEENSRWADIFSYKVIQ